MNTQPTTTPVALAPKAPIFVWHHHIPDHERRFAAMAVQAAIWLAYNGGKLALV